MCPASSSFERRGHGLQRASVGKLCVQLAGRELMILDVIYPICDRSAGNEKSGAAEGETRDDT
jgi:hypothetical protein